MKWFKGISNLQELRKKYVALSQEHHPDKGGDTATMQEINAEYDALKNNLPFEGKFEVEVTTEELQTAVDAVTSILDKSRNNANENSVDLTADKDKLNLTAQNKNAWKITASIPADVKSGTDTRLTIKAKSLQISKFMAKSDSTILSFEGGELNFNDNFTASVACEKHEGKKYFLGTENAKKFSIDAKYFNALVGKVISAAAKAESSRRAFTGVFVEVEGNKISFTTTNGNSFATVEGEIKEKVDGSTILIPAETLKTLSKIAKEGNLQVAFDEKYISFTCGNLNFESRLLNYIEQFPIQEIKKMMPQELETSSVISSAELKKVVAGTELVAKFDCDKVLKFSFKTDCGLILEGLAENCGSAKIQCHAISSSDTTATVNVSYFKDALSRITAEYVMIGKAKVGGKPVLTLQDNNESFCYVISQIDLTEKLQRAEENILRLEKELEGEDEKIADVQAEVKQAQKDIADKETEIETAEENLKAAKQTLRQAKNALKKAIENQVGTETENLRQKAVVDAEKAVADLKAQLETKQAEHTKIANWIDSFPVRSKRSEFNSLRSSLEHAKTNYAELLKKHAWRTTLAA